MMIECKKVFMKRKLLKIFLNFTFSVEEFYFVKMLKKGFDPACVCVCFFRLGVSSISFFCRYDKAGVDWNVIIIQTGDANLELSASRE